METIYTISGYFYEFVEYYIFNFFEKPYNNEKFNIFIKNEDNQFFQKEVDKIINDTIYEIKVEKEIKILEKRYVNLVNDYEIYQNSIKIIDEDDDEDDNINNNNNNNGKIALLI